MLGSTVKESCDLLAIPMRHSWTVPANKFIPCNKVTHEKLMFHRRPVPDMRPDRTAIMDKVDLSCEINLVTGCWEWEKYRNALGYAETWWKGRTWVATRLIYAAHHGPFDPQLDICHSCDNPGCVNPEHIRVDAHQANLMDASRKKRLQGQWKTHCKRGHPLSGTNLLPWSKYRNCRECRRWRAMSPEQKAKHYERQRQWRAKIRAQRSATDG